MDRKTKKQFKDYFLEVFKNNPDRNKWLIAKAEYVKEHQEIDKETINNEFQKLVKNISDKVDVYKDAKTNALISKRLSKEETEKWWNDLGKNFIEDNDNYSLFIEDEQSNAVTICYYDKDDKAYTRLSAQIKKRSIIYGYFSDYNQKSYKTSNNIKEAWIKIEVALYDTGRVFRKQDPYRINFNNGLYNIQTKELEPHNKDYFTLDKIKLNYDKEANEMPLWQKHLEIISQGNQTMIDMIQEMFGYVLFTVGNKAHKMHYLYGKLARNGKSTTLKVLEMLVGYNNVSKISMEELSKISGSQNAQELLGKKLNISEEGEDVYLKSDAITNLTSEGELMIKRLYENPYKGKVTANFVAASNYLPRFKDSAGMDNRLIIIPFNYHIPEVDRIMGFEENIAEKELPAILNWAEKGLERINKQGWTKSQESIEAMRTVKSGASSTVDYWNFLIDNKIIIFGKNFYEPRANIFSEKKWGDDVKTYNEFYKAMNSSKIYSVSKTKFNSDTERFWNDYNKEHQTKIFTNKIKYSKRSYIGFKLIQGDINWDEY